MYQSCVISTIIAETTATATSFEFKTTCHQQYTTTQPLFSGQLFQVEPHLLHSSHNLAIISLVSTNKPKALSMMYQKRHRTTFNQYQLAVLNEAFKQNSYPSASNREALALKTSLDTSRVQVWFQNRRAKQKKQFSQAMRYFTGNNSHHHHHHHHNHSHHFNQHPLIGVAMNTSPATIKSHQHDYQQQHQHQHYQNQQHLALAQVAAANNGSANIVIPAHSNRSCSVAATPSSASALPISLTGAGFATSQQFQNNAPMFDLKLDSPNNFNQQYQQEQQRQQEQQQHHQQLQETTNETLADQQLSTKHLATNSQQYYNYYKQIRSTIEYLH